MVNELELMEKKELSNMSTEQLRRLIYSKEFGEIFENTIKNQFFEGISQEDSIQMLEAYSLHVEEKGFDSCVYFLQDKARDLIKIGMTSNLNQRLKSIKREYANCGLNHELELLACFMCRKKYVKQMEKFYHKLFSKNRFYGEWFKIKRFDFFMKLFNLYEDIGLIYSSVQESVYYFTFDLYNKFPSVTYSISDFKCTPNLVNNRFNPANKYKSKTLLGCETFIDLFNYNCTSEYPICGLGMAKRNPQQQYFLPKNKSNLNYGDIMVFYIENIKNDFLIKNNCNLLQKENVDGGEIE